MKNLALIALILFPSAYGSSICPLKGNELELPFGYEITSKKTTKEADLIVLEPSKNNPYGGAKQTWKLYKDSMGRIIKIESGLTTPTSQLVQFEIEKRRHNQTNKELYRDNENSNLVPSLSDLKKLTNDPIHRPIKYGGIVEMSHENGECIVTNVKEKLFDPTQKLAVENPLYDEAYCPKIEKAYASISRELQECSDRSDRENEIVASIRNTPRDVLATTSLPDNDRQKVYNLTSGSGGGGGSPATGRSIASISSPENQSSFSINNHLAFNGEARLDLRSLNKLCIEASKAQIRRTTIHDNSSVNRAIKN